jgi:hypothetical protein
VTKSIDGYEVAYTHRGSWKASRTLNGVHLDDVPVAWSSDWVPPSLTVLFKTPEEAELILSLGKPFVVAVATKKDDGSSSSSNINGLFRVQPLSAVGEAGVKCEVLLRVKASEVLSDANR